jgi:hypothetical protein
MLVTRTFSAWLALPCVLLVGVGGIIPDVDAGGAGGPPAPLPPELLTWGAKRETGNLWTIYGTVRGMGQTSVNVWGLPGIDTSIPVNANGSFAMTFNLADGVSGYVLLQAVDSFGQFSEVEDFGIFPAQ